MTHKEMSEIFAVMLLAYPNAEVFKGGVAKLGPTINLWVTALPEIDFWTGRQAVVKLVRECKYPPTIAEFKEKADAIQVEMKNMIRTSWAMLKLSLDTNGVDATVKGLPPDSNQLSVISIMGGPDKLVITENHTMGDGRIVPHRRYNYEGYAKAWETLLRKEDALAPAPKRPAIGGGKKQIGG